MSQLPPDIPRPLRVEPLSYHAPPSSTRPGLLTAVGIISIVVGSLSIIGNCSSIGQAVLFGAMAKMPMPVVAPAAAPPVAQRANAGGLSDAQKRIVVETLGRLGNLSLPRREMLEQLLEEDGSDMFPFAPPDFNTARVRGYVSESGKLPSPGTKVGNHWFVIGTGRIELADDHAVFSPTGGRPSVRVYRDALPPYTATPAAAQSVVFMPGRGISRTATTITLINGVLGMMLAIYLLISGIFVLRDSLRGRRLHLIFAGLKIPQAIFGAFAYSMYYSEMMSAMAPMSSGVLPPSTMYTALGAFWAALACIYPISLLIVMNTRGVKEYYRLGQDRLR